MSDTLVRQLEMLRCLPHWPGKTNTATLQEKLSSSGFEVSVRTIQRDLQKLSRFFPIASDEISSHLGWYWMKGAESFNPFHMPPHIAMTFQLVERFSQSLLPQSSVSYLSPYFKTADDTLLELSDNSLANWAEKVFISQRVQPTLPPVISEEVYYAVYLALLEERKINLTYHSLGSSESRTAVVNPLAVLVREPIIYLVCTFWDYEDVRQIPLHRICQAEVLDETAVIDSDFKVAEFVRSSDQDIVLNDEIKLVAKLSPVQGEYLLESPLSDSQEITKGDEWYSLKAEVKDTMQLRRWILSLTGDMEIVEPIALRDEIAATVRKQSQMYK
ncbi:helix-turn-helix transcriptional regulator [Neptuniibacter sp. QD48_11]|uniref:helix-turn-helix transcriptional regulator n=1 Tax=Neptuniibacter sp. QD48_11 TaxID=3398211 RepID=UPI0039F5C209